MKKFCFLFLCFACRDGGSAPSPAASGPPAAITVTSAAFGNGATIPTGNTCHGVDTSPEINWTELPNTARSAALIVDDPDAPSGTFTHWIVWNIKPESRLLGAANGGLGGGMAGTNDFDHVGYGGPCPPAGKVHHYRFTLYGLDTTLNLRATDKRSDLDKAMNHHIVAQGTLTGTFGI